DRPARAGGVHHRGGAPAVQTLVTWQLAAPDWHPAEPTRLGGSPSGTRLRVRLPATAPVRRLIPRRRRGGRAPGSPAEHPGPPLRRPGPRRPRLLRPPENPHAPPEPARLTGDAADLLLRRGARLCDGIAGMSRPVPRCSGVTRGAR